MKVIANGAVNGAKINRLVIPQTVENIKAGAFEGLQDCERIYIEGYDSEPNMVNYPGRQNFPKLLETGWDKVSDESISLPIVWELEKLSDNVGYWTSMKYENEDGTIQDVLQFEDTSTTSVDVPNVMSIDTFTVNNKEFKVCDVADVEAIRTASAEGTDDYKEFVKYGSEWVAVYGNVSEILENDPYIEYTLDYDSWTVYPLRLKAGVNWDEILKTVGADVFEMADMKKTKITMDEEADDYWVDWSQFDFSSILQYSQFRRIRLPFNSWNFIIPKKLSGFDVILMDPKQYTTVKDCPDFKLYNSFNYKYRYAIDFEKNTEETAQEQIVLRNAFKQDFKRLDLIGGKSYQFDRTNPGLNIDLLNAYDYESAVSRNNERLELNIYGKLSQNFLTIPAQDGMVKNYGLDFVIYGTDLESLSQADKDAVEYLKTYSGCTFTFIKQPKEENAKEWEQLEDINKSGFESSEYPDGKTGLILKGKKENDLGQMVFKDEYGRDGSIVNDKDLVIGYYGWAQKPFAENTSEFIVEGNSLISGMKTFENNNTKTIKSKIENFEKFGETYSNGLENTSKLRKINGLDVLTISKDMKNRDDMISAVFSNTSLKLSELVVNIYSSVELTEDIDASFIESFMGVKNIDTIRINIDNKWTYSISATPNERMFYQCKAKDIYLAGFKDNYFEGIAAESQFVSSDCSMVFHVENETQKQGLEAAIIRVLGIPDMSQTDITVEIPPEEASLNWEYSVDEASKTLILNKYIGTNPEVMVKNAYSVDGVVYNNVAIKEPEVIEGQVVGPFSNNTLITSVSFAKNIKLPASIRYLFYFCNNLTSVDVKNLDVRNTSDIHGAFYGCSALTSLDLSSWDTSNAINLRQMFAECSSLASLDISSWNTSKANNMNYMFYNCKALTSLNLSSWDTSNVTDMGEMFSGCEHLASLDISSWNTSKVTNMNHMFNWCKALTSLNLSNWDVSNVTNMIWMFNLCSSLTSLNLSGWDVSNVIDIYGIFRACSSLASLNLSGWNISKANNMNYMFYNCKALTSLDLSNWKVSNVTNMQFMFGSCEALTSLDVSSWDVSNVTNMNGMFGGCEALTSLDLSGWDVSNVTNMGSMFSICYALVSLDLSNWKVSNVTNMNSMFFACSGLKTIYVKDETTKARLETDASVPEGCKVIAPEEASLNWEYVTENASNTIILNKYIGTSPDVVVGRSYLVDGVEYKNVMVRGYNDDYSEEPTFYRNTLITSLRFNSKVKLPRNMDSFFDGCSGLTLLDVSGLDVSNVTNMSQMFRDCRALTSLDLSGWNVYEVTNMSSMFYNCSGLTSLDLSTSNAPNVIDMSRMFYGCSGLTSLDLSNWSMANATNMSEMFVGCQALTSLDLSNWYANYSENIDYMFIGCNNLKAIYVRDEGAKTILETTTNAMVPEGCEIIIGHHVSTTSLLSEYSVSTMALNDAVDTVDASETTTTKKKRGRPKKTTENTTNNDEV